MSLGYFAGRVVGVRELRGDVELGAAAIVGPSDALGDPVEVRFQFCSGIGLVEFCYRVPVAPEVLVFALQEGSDEVVLGVEVALEAGLGDPSLFDDEVNADGPHASLIEERRGRAEDTVPHLGGVAVLFNDVGLFGISRHIRIS